jgi:uncharacterized membrane protein YvlD (DUF360 family)
MKKSYSAEILLLVSASFCGIIVGIGKWWMILIGGLLLSIVSYFLTPLLKAATIKEYIAETKKTSEAKHG